MKKKLFQLPTGLLLLVFTFFTVSVVQAQDFVWAPDFAVGSTMAPIEAPDQNGEIKTFEDLVGENGLLIMFSRSFDW